MHKTCELILGACALLGAAGCEQAHPALGYDAAGVPPWAANTSEAIPTGVAGGPTVRGPQDDADPMLECPHAAGGMVSVLRAMFHCGSITTYTCKDLSNVVLEFADGTRQRFEGQSGHVNTFVGTGANAGKVVVRVWVKAGANQSGDGPGYGERVDAPDQACAPPPAAGGGGCVVTPDGICAPTSGVGGHGAAGCEATPDGFCAGVTAGVGGHAAAGAAGSDSPQ